MAGDIFQLGNASWRVLQVGVRHGARRRCAGRAADDSVLARRGAGAQRRAVARRQRLRAEIEARLATLRYPASAETSKARRGERGGTNAESEGRALTFGWPSSSRERPRARRRLAANGVRLARTRPRAEQAVAYLADARGTLGVLPTQEVLVLERFFDESGGMQLVLHAPFGSRINKAWGLALRKRFCRQFNFELQAAATEDALLLSLGPQHSFPLADVFRYLHPATARDVLVRHSSMRRCFRRAGAGTRRSRWPSRATAAAGRFRRSSSACMADDLMAAVFPDAAACLENIPGDRQIPDHPLVDADGPRLPRRRRWTSRDWRGARAHSSRRAPAGLARHARAVVARARNSERAAVRVPRRCAARRAADAGGATPVGRASRRSADDLGALDRAPSSGCATRCAPIRGMPTSCTTRCSRAGFLHSTRTRPLLRGGWLDRLIETRAGGEVALGTAGWPCMSGSPPNGCPRSLAVHPNAPIDGQVIGARVTRRAHMDAATRQSSSCFAAVWRLSVRRPRARSPHRSSIDPRRRSGAASRSNRKGRSCAVFHRRRARARMVRPSASRAHPSLHAEPLARGNRAGQSGRFHAVPLHVAARRRRRAG